MKQILKILFTFWVLLILFSPFKYASADTVKVHFFRGEGCPHCADEEEFFKDLKQNTYLDFEVDNHEIWYNRDNAKMLADAAKEFGWTVQGVPFTVIGEKYVSGFGSAESTGVQIKEMIQECAAGNCEDKLDIFLSANTAGDVSADQQEKETSRNLNLPDKLVLPVIGEINPQNFSLLALSAIIGGIDGFNPCAMWVLIFLIGLLLGMENKRRRWALGSTFIVASAAFYFMILAAWLNLMLFIGYIAWVRAGIGVVALLTGAYSVREYFVNKDATCKVTAGEKRRATFEKLKQFVHEKSFWVAMGGIAVLAVAVNMVEFVCSAGLPAIFTQVLALSDLSGWQHYGYLLVYILFFMLDDLIIFSVAMKTLEIKAVSAKYSRYSNLIGGAIMLIVGVLLLLKPEWLMFG